MHLLYVSFLYVVAVFMFVLSVVLLLREIKYNKEMQKNIDNHNKAALFIYNEDDDLTKAWIKDKNFLLSTNGGRHPSEFNGEISMFDYKSAYCLEDIQER